MTGTQRRVLLALALFATLVATWAVSVDGAIDRTPQAVQPRAPRPAEPERGELGEGRESHSRDEAEAEALTLFDAVPWNPAVLAPSTSTPAANPEAVVVADAGPPPLPFQPLGRYDDQSGPVVFLLYRDQNLIVRRGESFAEQYRLEEINGAVLKIRHLPSNEIQTLDMGGSV